MTVTLEIPGRPVPKGRPRRGRGGRWYTPRRTVEYEERIAWCCRAERVRLGAAPVTVRVELWTQRPLRADIDNVLKAVLDGLQRGEAIANDEQVVDATITRVVGGVEEKTVVRISMLLEESRKPKGSA